MSTPPHPSVDAYTIRAQKEVFEAVLTSDKLKHANRTKKVFAYLWDRYFNGKTSSTDEIAEECFSDHHSSHETRANAVRGAIRSLKRHLKSYFKQQGHRHVYSIEIPNGPSYTLEFTVRVHAVDCFNRFWWTYPHF